MSPAQLSASQKKNQKKTEFEIRNFESGIRFKTDLMHEPEIPATKRKTKKNKTGIPTWQSIHLCTSKIQI